MYGVKWVDVQGTRTALHHFRVLAGQQAWALCNADQRLLGICYTQYYGIFY